MLTPVSDLYGMSMNANNGEIGRIQDVYFNELDWTIRCLVVDTAGWLPGRKVLVSPYSARSASLKDALMNVSLARRKIEKAPSCDTHRPVSRQYDEALHRYDGLPKYWQGRSVWGVSGFPIAEMPPTDSLENRPGDPVGPRPPGDPHLRSTQAVKGYHFETAGRIAGQVVDFIINRSTWTLEQLVIRQRSWFAGGESLIPMSRVTRISCPDSTVTGTCNVQKMGSGRDDSTAEIPRKRHPVPALGIA